MKRLILICWLMLAAQGCLSMGERLGVAAIETIITISQDYGTPPEDPQNEKDKNK